MAISMSPKENMLACLSHKPHQYTPCFLDMAPCGLFEPFERGGVDGGTDIFGVRWVSPRSGGMMSCLPAPGEFLLTDITKWKSVITFPTNLDWFDWEGTAEAQLANMNRDTTALECVTNNMVYERIAAFMGFEEALMAMAEEPEAVYELFEAIVDWKIMLLKYYAKYWKPDAYTYCDDVATERNLFMSPDTYRKLIKPFHTRMVKEANELGMMAIQHTCGKADLLVEDMIDEGNDGWGAVQAQNDLAGIIEKYGDKFVLIGGYDTTGPTGQLDCTEEMARAETRRCMEEYGKFGKGYVFTGMVMTGRDDNDQPIDSPANAALFDEFFKIRAEQTA